MILPSYSFIFIFLPAVIILYHLANIRQLYVLGKYILLISSLLFYLLLVPGIKGLAALTASAAVSYVIGTFGLSNKVPAHLRRIMLAAGIVLNIGFLIYCRYLSYIDELITKAGGASLTFSAIVIPVGISYFTFSQTAFLVDTYRNPDIRYSFSDYFLFVSFFPKVTVGPIALSTEMIPQFNDITRKNINWDNLSVGFYRFTLGLAKKLLIADNLGSFVDMGYSNISNLGTADTILVILSYTMQIYFDFSGYCDLASGICLMLNFDLCENFDGPYRSLSIREFWKRWHITLTRFFRDYLYIPMGGNRKGKFRMHLNNLLIFLISGLWHGAATHFVLWGGLHGIGMVISRLISHVTERVPKAVRWLATFSFVNIAWVFFRADDTSVALDLLKRLVTGRSMPINSTIIATCIPAEFGLMQWLIGKASPDWSYYSGCAVWITLVALALYLSAFSKTVKERCASFAATKRKSAATVILFIWSVLSLSEVAQFIYVNF